VGPESLVNPSPTGAKVKLQQLFGEQLPRGKASPRAEPPGTGPSASHLPAQPPRLVHAEVPGAPHSLDGHGTHRHGSDLQQTCGGGDNGGDNGVSPAAPSRPRSRSRRRYSLCGLWLPAASTRPSPPILRKQLKSPCLLAV